MSQVEKLIIFKSYQKMSTNQQLQTHESDNFLASENLVSPPNEASPLLASNQSSLASYTDSQNHFGDSRRGGRRPFHYLPLIDAHYESLPDTNSSAVYNRLKYYNRLTRPSDGTLRIPNHMVPPVFFYGIPLVGPTRIEGRQSSIVTIFVIWNTMVGTSLLSMPWAIGQAGFTFGIILMIFMATICFYTAYRILCVQKHFGGSSVGNADFTDICEYLLGRFGALASIFFSLCTLLGAAIVCWILCTNFLYYIVYYLHDAIEGIPHTNPNANTTHINVICHNPPINNSNILRWTKHPSRSEILFNEVWDLHLTVPLVMIFILGPLVNVKSPDFFAKFSALGTLSVMFLISFISAKAATWGFHLNFKDINAVDYAPHFKGTFFALSGTLSLSLFIHNCILSIMRNQRNPEHNGRDLGIAYTLVTLTYLFIGAVFYAAFPLAKSCIEDNLLNNINGHDLLAFLARVFLFFQILTVCPLIYYIFRIQFMYYLFGSIYPGYKHVLLLNMGLMTISVLFAIFLPSIGTIIRFSGAFCGLAYIFALPCLAYMVSMQQRGQLTITSCFIHVIIMLLGITNFLAQFVYL